jgi:hypothetical protein
MFNQAQVLLDARARDHRKPATKMTDVLLGGIILCGNCGKAVSRIAKNEWQTRYYCNRARITRGTVCNEPRYNSTMVDDAAVRLLIRGLKLRRQQIIAGGHHQPIRSDDALVAELKVAEAEKEQLMTLFRKGYIDELKLDAEMVPLLSKIDAIKAKLTEVAAPTSVDDLTRAVKAIEELWPAYSYDKKRMILRTYVPKGFVLADGTLRATVCGLPIETQVAKLESPEPGKRYGKLPWQSKAAAGAALDHNGDGRDERGCYPTRQSRRSDQLPIYIK